MRIETQPRVSVLMPNYNGAEYLAAAVESVVAQTYPDFELVVVDDGSTNGSFELLQRLAAAHPQRVRLHTHDGHQNKGLAATYAHAQRSAEGTVLAFCESDDLWAPDNLAVKVDLLQRHPEVGVVHSHFRPFGARRGGLYRRLYAAVTKRTTPAARPYDPLSTLLLRNPIPSFTHFIVRRSLLAGIPPLPVMQRNYDWWVLAHLALRCRFCFSPAVLTAWRIHKTSAHYGPKVIPFGELRDYLLALYESLAASPELRGDAERTERVASARRGLLQLEHMVQRDRLQLARNALRHPLVSMCFVTDVALRRVLFA